MAAPVRQPRAPQDAAASRLALAACFQEAPHSEVHQVRLQANTKARSLLRCCCLTALPAKLLAGYRKVCNVATIVQAFSHTAITHDSQNAYKLEMAFCDLAADGADVTFAGQTRWSLQYKTLLRHSLAASLWSPQPLTCRRAMLTPPLSPPSSLCCLLAQTPLLPSCSLLPRKICQTGLHCCLC